MSAFDHVQPVRVTDFGPSLHMDNISYQEFVQESREAFFRDRGVSRGNEGAQPVLVRKIVLDYLAPVPYGTREMTTRVTVTHIGRTSFRMHHSMRAGGTEVATAEVVVIACDADERPAELTPHYREALEGALVTESEPDRGAGA